MPLYEYECKACKTEFSATRPVADYNKPTPCPKCIEPQEVNVLLAATPGRVAGGTPRFHR